MGKVSAAAAAAAFVAFAGHSRRHLSTTTFSRSLENRVENALRDECGVCGGEVIVTMVSGGCDSVALLHLLMDVKDRWQPSLEIEALHFDHCLREESGSDAEFVRSLCERVGASLRVERWNSAAQKATQSTARDWRRREAVRVLGDRVGRVALAHHADDQIETALLRLARGGRLTRVFQGMETYSAPFVRPLLTSTKSDLIDYLKSLDEPWVEDATNADPDKYSRNAVRHNVVPGLQKVARGQLRRRLDALARQSVAVEEWTRANADDYEADASLEDEDGCQQLLLRKEQQQWDAVPPPVRFELLARLVSRAGGSAHFASIVDLDEAILRPDDEKVSWELWMPGGVRVCRVDDRLKAFRKRREDTEDRKVAVSVADVLVTLPEPSWSFEGERGATASLDNSVSLRGIPPNSRLELRFRRDGDRFHPSWREYSVKMKDFLRGQRVPLAKRDAAPLLVLSCDDDYYYEEEEEEREEVVVAVFLDDVVHVARPHLVLDEQGNTDAGVFRCRISNSRQKEERVTS